MKEDDLSKPKWTEEELASRRKGIWRTVIIAMIIALVFFSSALLFIRIK